MAGVWFPCSWRNYRPTCCQEPWLGEASEAPSRRAGGGADGNSITPGSADCLIYFKIKQMAAAGVCLSSAQSRARGQEPQGSCAKNFSMTLVVKPPLPLPFELQPHHTHGGLLAPSPSAGLLLHLLLLFCLCLSVSLPETVLVFQCPPHSPRPPRTCLCLCFCLSCCSFSLYYTLSQETFPDVLPAP